MRHPNVKEEDFGMAVRRGEEEKEEIAILLCIVFVLGSEIYA